MRRNLVWLGAGLAAVACGSSTVGGSGAASTTSTSDSGSSTSDSATASLANTTSTSTAGSGGSGGATAGSGGAGGTESGWRSTLYPKDWTLGFATPQGRHVQDYSYAGYHHGEAALGTPAVATVFDVTTYGADPKGGSDATAAAQQAIDAAKSNGGGVVYFPTGTYRLDGQLSIKASKIVLRGEGANASLLAFTKSAGMGFLSHITIGGTLSDSSEQLLTAEGAENDTTVAVADASAYKLGDDIVIGFTITPAFIAEHQMNGTWDHSGNAFAGKWQPFFRREVTQVDTTKTPHTISFAVPLRYPTKLRDNATIRRQTGYLSEVGVEKLGLANAVSWDAAWNQNQVHVLELHGVRDSWVRDVGSFSPPNAPTSGSGKGAHLQSSGLLLLDVKSVTIADSGLHKAENRGGGGNGYLFEVRQSNEVLFRDLAATEGRHNFIQNWGFGVTGCVWQRVHSSGGIAWLNKDFPGLTGVSEFHHSLGLGNLVDASTFDDGWAIVNRGNESTYSGHTGTENVMWNTSGTGTLRSRQFGDGYVVGTTSINVQTTLDGLVFDGANTAPEDFTEGLGAGETLVPQSLYDDQLAKRLAP